VADWAVGHGLPVVDAQGPASTWARDLASHDIEWLFSITHLSLLPDEVLAIPSAGAVNFHDGPLPAYAGLNTPAWALHLGETEYGITWHAITSGVDEGDVLLAADFELSPGETSLSLNTRNFETAIDTFGALVDSLAAGTAVAVPQDPAAPRRTFSRHDRIPAMAVLDWRRPAAELERTVRALTFGPYPNPLGVAKVWTERGALVVLGAELDDPDATGEPGEVLSAADGRVVVACGEGALALTSLADLRGVPLEEPPIRAGDRLPHLSDDVRAALTDADQLLARAERRHLRLLERRDPIEVPWARTPTADHSARPAMQPLDVPRALVSEPGAVVGAFAVLLSRLTDRDAVQLGLWGGSAAVHPEALPFVADGAPIEVAVNPTDDLREIAAVTSAQLDAAAAVPGYAHELIARTPTLVHDAALASGRLLPVGVALEGTGPMAAGVVAEVRQIATGWELGYDAGLIEADDAALLARCLESVLVQADAAPATLVAGVDLLGPELRAQVLERWNDTARPIPSTTIHELIEAQVDRTPDATAVVFEDQALTYRELDERANQLAHHLIDLGVGPDGLVGLHLQRGLDLVVAVLAVHKAGGAYVPLDPAYPTERLRHMVDDSGCRVLLTDTSLVASRPAPADSSVTVVELDAAEGDLLGRPPERPSVASSPEQLAYCIYTSGSTGLPKGVLVEHRNAVNFFVGMDERVPHELPATWFAVTSLSFDISVLELLYTLTRGFTVVVYLDRDRGEGPHDAPALQHPNQPIGFSLFYFSGDAAEGTGADKYRLLLDGARFADTHGFEAVWTPERHFHAFGGLYPQPAVTGAAVAAITEHVAIRAGSVVLPLHHPIRVAEEWSIVDNLSNGRVAISVASGWQPNDFVLMPQNHANAKQAMFEGLEVVQRLWRGETIEVDGPLGTPVSLSTLPRPVQPELPVWVTTAGNPESYIQAGRIGANVLTHLLGQSIEQLAPKIEAYRSARAEAGFDPDAGQVTLMLHTFVGDDEDAVREAVREPLKTYLGTSFSLLKEYAWAFPAFQRPGGSSDADGLRDDDFEQLSEDDLDAVLEFAFLRYYESSGLFGTPARCAAFVDRLKAIGVGEIACLIDFGVPTDAVLASLPLLDEVRQRCNPAPAEVTAAAPNPADQSVAGQLARHAVTHLQCTPSMARMLLMQGESRVAIADVEHLFIGGEAFPVALARDLVGASRSGNVTNMYGPTETTIWSTTWPLGDDLDSIPIGTPIANTQVYVLDKHRQPLPPGVYGELWIGGHGVVRGYHERPDLTKERFVADPFRGGDHRMYLTGDIARWRPLPDGTAVLDFLGRADHQVKIRGYRIELGEIEAQLGRLPGVLECVAVVREDTPGDQQLVAYASTQAGATLDPADVKARLRASLPEVMVPAHVAVLPSLPHTPNGKIDRNALPSLAEVLGARAASREHAAADNDLERSVLAVWEDVLGTNGIGVDDNFFDIGGHSLLIVRMHRRLRDELDPSIALTDLYRFPTVRGFAASLAEDSTAATIQTSIDRAARRRETMQRRRRR
jgi:natural product biosynthesis luciferase-like monooxygenase protein